MKPGFRALQVVHLQAAVGTNDPSAEVAWLEECRRRVALPMAFVAYADLTDPRLDKVLERHLADGNVCGFETFDMTATFLITAGGGGLLM